jgi:hypothetical protein
MFAIGGGRDDGCGRAHLQAERTATAGTGREKRGLLTHLMFC